MSSHRPWFVRLLLPCHNSAIPLPRSFLTAPVGSVSRHVRATDEDHEQHARKVQNEDRPARETRIVFRGRHPRSGRDHAVPTFAGRILVRDNASRLVDCLTVRAGSILSGSPVLRCKGDIVKQSISDFAESPSPVDAKWAEDPWATSDERFWRLYEEGGVIVH